MSFGALRKDFRCNSRNIFGCDPADCLLTQGKMVAIAIFSTDPAMRRSLEQLLREDSTFSIVGVVDDPTAISLLIDQNHVNVVLADVPLRERLADWRIRHNQTAFVIFVGGADEEDSLDTLYAGARARLRDVRP